jgi:hypothetical protein
MHDPYEVLQGLNKAKQKFNRWAGKTYIANAHVFVDSQVDNLLFNTYVIEKNTRYAENIFVAEQQITMDVRQLWPGFYSLLDVLNHDIRSLEQLVQRTERLIALASCQHAFAVITAMPLYEHPPVRYHVIPVNFYNDLLGEELIHGSIDSFVHNIDDESVSIQPGEFAQFVITSYPDQDEEYAVQPVPHYINWKNRLEKTLQDYKKKQTEFLGV